MEIRAHQENRDPQEYQAEMVMMDYPDYPAPLDPLDPLDSVKILLLNMILPNLQNLEHRVLWDQEDLQDPLDLPALKVSKVFPANLVNPVKLAL